MKYWELELIAKHLRNSINTSKGHLNREHQGLRSTKPTPLDSKEKQDIIDDFNPPEIIKHTKEQDVICTVISNEKMLGYMDLCGPFPFKSSSGNEYLLVVYNYTGNSIMVEPIKNCQAKTITEGWKKIHEQFEI